MSHEFVGWNNELWKFDLTTLTWSSPECSGAAPSPRAAHTLTICSKDRWVFSLYIGAAHTSLIRRHNIHTTVIKAPASARGSEKKKKKRPNRE